MSAVGSVALGLGAALRAPLWLRGPRLRRLMSPAAAASPALEDDGVALRASYRALRLLAALPGSPWRNTCLYRSVAECLVLRARGVDARVRVGVRRSSSRTIEGHAWVVRGAEPAPGATDYSPLSHPGGLARS